MGSGFMRANTRAAEQDKDKAEAKIAALHRLANQEGLSHAASDPSQAVFTLGADELIEFEGRPLEIPCPAYCVPCDATLDNSTACQRHLTGGPHKNKLKQMLAKLQAKSKPDTPTRGSFAPSRARATSSRASAAPAPSRESAATFQCAASRCSGVCALQTGDVEARRTSCNLLQRVPRGHEWKLPAPEPAQTGWSAHKKAFLETVRGLSLPQNLHSLCQSLPFNLTETKFKSAEFRTVRAQKVTWKHFTWATYNANSIYGRDLEEAITTTILQRHIAVLAVQETFARPNDPPARRPSHVNV